MFETHSINPYDPFDADLWGCGEAAQVYAARGWRVVPLYGIAEREDGTLGCECDNLQCEHPGKHPRIKNWPTRSTTNASLLALWWRTWPLSNVGVATGPKSSLVVLDFDPRNGSEESLVRLIMEHGDLPSTLTSLTGAGGDHRLFQWPVGRYITERLPALREFRGIDVQAAGKLIVAPPSLHLTGHRYRWVDFSEPLAALPEALLRGVPRDLTTMPPPCGTSAWAWTAMAREYARVRHAEPGSRNQSLYIASRKLGEIVAGDGLDADEVREYLLEAAQEVGVRKDEAKRTIESGLIAGQHRPRQGAPAFTSRKDAVEFMGLLRAVVQGLPWRSHKGKRMLATLESLIRIAMRQGGPKNFACGIRRIAIEAGISNYGTVLRAVEELQADGWLIRESRGCRGVPSRWTLRLPLGLNPTPPEVKSGHVASGELLHTLDTWGVVDRLRHQQSPIGHDAFRGRVAIKRSAARTGMGVTGWRLWEALLGNGHWMSQAALSRATGVHRSTVGRHIGVLADVGLVEKSPDGVRAIPHTDEALNAIARSLGVLGASLRQRRTNGWTILPALRPTVQDGVVHLASSLPENRTCPHRPPCDPEAEDGSGCTTRTDESR